MHTIRLTSWVQAQLAIVELLEHKSIFSAGYTAVLHVHAAAEECSIVRLTSQVVLPLVTSLLGFPPKVALFCWAWLGQALHFLEYQGLG